jgi:hypothetical protein
MCLLFIQENRPTRTHSGLPCKVMILLWFLDFPLKEEKIKEIKLCLFLSSQTTAV